MLLKEKLRNGNQLIVPADYVDHTDRILVFHKLDISVKNNFRFFNIYVISFLCLSNICTNYCNLKFIFLVYIFWLYFSWLTLISMYILLYIELLFLLVHITCDIWDTNFYCK